MNRSPYITALEDAAKSYPHRVAFKLPILQGKRVIAGWMDVTYEQLYEKLNNVAKYWLQTLKLSPGSVVGLWLSGIPFSDFLHIFGIMRAGYIPHILNSELTKLDVVKALFKSTAAAAVIYAPSVSNLAEELSTYFPCHLAVEADEIPDNVISSNFSATLSNNDTVVIVHTSGSTSGRPKPVRLSQGWFIANAQKQIIRKGSSPIVPRMGSLCHVGQLGYSLMYFLEAACVVVLPWIDYTAEEIVRMHKECGLTVFTQFTPLLSETIRLAQTSPQLLDTLQSFPVVFYYGGALCEAEINWCTEKKIALKTSLASTEVGLLMVSTSSPSLLKLIVTDGCYYKMLRVDDDQTWYRSEPDLLELVVLPDSLDCPEPSLCNPDDGIFHTSDIFEEINPGAGIYKYRGRLDDIITMRNGRNCDTKYIEDRVYALCKELISTCVVVGTDRPSPALLVEPLPVNMGKQEITRCIAERVASINAGGYPHEQIFQDHILVVSKGELPRTSFKRNVIRLATEIKFKDQIDALYA